MHESTLTGEELSTSDLIQQIREYPLTPNDVYAHGRSVGIPHWQKWLRSRRRRAERELLGLLTEGDLAN